MSVAKAGQLIGTGLSFGVIHVLTGPDHLSALATLSVGSSWKAFALGIRWGLGHSSGLFIVASVFLAMDGAIDIDKIDSYCNWIVGVAMIGLGGYSMYITFINNRRREMGRAVIHSSAEMFELELEELESENELQIDISEEEAGVRMDRQQTGDSFSIHPENPLQDPFTQKVVAFGVGIIHGIAGPGGILGVLPAVQLHSWFWSMLYLSSFALTSTLCMGLFAMIYGEVTARASDSQSVALKLSYFSASLSIIVGVVWIILLSLGKLHEIFP